MLEQKKLMAEAATLYYEKGMTQQEIAVLMQLSRQTVSKLIGEALKEKIVEIKIHNPESDCKALEEELCERFGLAGCVICPTGSKNESVRYIMTVKAAAQYIAPILEKGNLKIAVSWGKTMHDLIHQMPDSNTAGNMVFPLFGATDDESYYFSSNELARGLADKIGARVKYASFPYMADHAEDYRLLKKLSYYQAVEKLWASADVALLGIGNKKVLDIFEKHFGHTIQNPDVIGDVATHFFTLDGKLISPYKNALCASREDIRKIKTTIAVACGNEKAKAIVGAIRTKLIQTLITDEYTAKYILEYYAK